MSADRLRHIAKETLEIVRDGYYTNGTGQVTRICEAVHNSVIRTRLFTPDELRDIHRRVLLERPFQESFPVSISVRNQTLLAATQELRVQVGHYPVLCLNFASAKNPGGGFLNGAEAQEESLVRSSALFTTLVAAQGFYVANRTCGTLLYTDHAILSPDVPVIRDDAGMLLDDPYTMTFLTMPASNAGAYRRSDDKPVRETMTRRINLMLSLAVESGCEHLVLGAWGCGVFRNDPSFVARAFAEALSDRSPFRSRFREVVFAVRDLSKGQRFIGPFHRMFNDGSRVKNG